MCLWKNTFTFNTKTKTMRKNVPIFGFFFGIIMPIIGLVLYYLFLVDNTPFIDYIANLYYYNNSGALIITIALFLNLIPFTIFNNKRWEYASRGVFIATTLYAGVIVWLKFIA